MKKIILLIVIINSLFSVERPSIALVLSGGGAKGVSQIPTLHVLDSLNIPIDYVIGTSIGSITGGLYSIGYSSEEIKEIIFQTDWDLIMYDKKIRKKLSYFQKNDYHKYQLQFTINNFKPQIPIAFNSGHESYLYLNKLTRHNESINEFNDFVIPFRCNANDLLSGEEIIFKNGSLAKALRCSSSIPSVFSPVYDNKQLLVDGGVSNNLGTDIAKKLGADIIIAVDASSYSKERDDITDVFDVLSQSIQFNSLKKKKENIKLSTILIEPKLNYKQSMDFDEKSLSEMYQSGYNAIYKNIESLVKIKNDLPPTYKNDNNVKLSSINSDSVNILSISINSQSPIKAEELFNYNFTEKVSKLDLIDMFLKLRKTNLYNNIHYNFVKSKDDYELIINLEKNPSLLINNLIIEGNKKISSSLLYNILDIEKGDILNYQKIDAKINQLYNLDFFESIRYELVDIKSNSTDIKFIFTESDLKRLQIGISWSHYYQLIGKVQLDLINKPFNRFRIQNKLFVGNSMKENHFSLIYTGQHSNNVVIIPKINIITKKNKVSYYETSDQLINNVINEKHENFGLLFPITYFGYLELGINKQSINYPDDINKEVLRFYNMSLEIDQLDDILYPSDGYKIKYHSEKSFKNTLYTFSKLNIDYFKKITPRNSIRFFSNYFDSHNLTSIYKNINYFKSDQILGNSQYNLFSSNLLSYGFEVNYLYKSSQTFRAIINMLDNVTFKHNNETKKNYLSYGIGLRIKSIIGPIDFLWVKSHDDDELLENNKIENYYFSIGIDY